MRQIQTNHMSLRKARILLDFFMVSALLNGLAWGCTHSQSLDTKISSEERRIDNPEQLYRVSVRNENDTFYNGNVLVTIGFDKMLHWVFDNELEKGDRSHSAEGTGRSLKFKFGERFAGHRKRLQFALLPIMYKMGVITTLLTGLTVLVLKGLTIGVILLIFAFGNHFTKWHKSPQHNSQPIHVHVHSQDGHKKVTSYGLGPWDRGAEDTNSNSYYQDSEIESYQRRLFQNSAEVEKFKPLQQ